MTPLYIDSIDFLSGTVTMSTSEVLDMDIIAAEDGSYVAEVKTLDNRKFIVKIELVEVEDVPIH